MKRTWLSLDAWCETGTEGWLLKAARGVLFEQQACWVESKMRNAGSEVGGPECSLQRGRIFWLAACVLKCLLLAALIRFLVRSSIGWVVEQRVLFVRVRACSSRSVRINSNRKQDPMVERSCSERMQYVFTWLRLEVRCSDPCVGRLAPFPSVHRKTSAEVVG
eukprot:g74455.t1